MKNSRARRWNNESIIEYTEERAERLSETMHERTNDVPNFAAFEQNAKHIKWKQSVQISLMLPA